ncbi:MAG: YceI family protein [Polyangiaceae bacterium]|nr:YceI family protein [Polyangiaceae bacterium]
MSEALAPRSLPLQISLFTFKEGLLARAAHDLCLSVEKCSANLVAEKRVHAEIAVTSIRVDGAMENGVFQPNQLTESNRREIEGNIRERVLSAASHPLIRFDGTLQESTPQAPTFDVQGELEIRGVRRNLQAQGRRQAGTLSVEFEIKPSLFGIEPFRALMGAIRVADRVKVIVKTPEF